MCHALLASEVICKRGPMTSRDRHKDDDGNADISDRDIWAAANKVIKTYPEPVMHAAMRYDKLLDVGDIEGCIVWERIMKTIKDLLVR